MIRRTVVSALVVGLLVSGLLGHALADNRTHWMGPGPRPWQLGDPDWPAFSKAPEYEQYLAGDNAGLLWIDPVGPVARRIQPKSAGSALDRRDSLSRQYEVRILGRTIRIRR
jgi:hypothetical protein